MESIQEPVDDVFRERVERAHAMDAEDKLSSGFELFEFACGITRAGIRHQFPHANDIEVEQILAQRLALRAPGGGPVDAEEVMLEVVEVLTTQHVPYLLVGSFSSNFYGIPRSTKDVDIVVELKDQPVQTITRHLGPRYSLQPQVAFESVTGTTRHIVDVVGTQFKVELFRVGNDPHDRKRFERRQSVTWLKRQVWLPTAEDVIVTKLRWLSHLRRNKDYDDILQVMSVQRGNLDWPYMEGWCQQHGTRVILEEIRAAVPDV